MCKKKSSSTFLWGLRNQTHAVRKWNKEIKCILQTNTQIKIPNNHKRNSIKNLSFKVLSEKMEELHWLIKNVRLWIHLLSVKFNSYNPSTFHIMQQIFVYRCVKLCSQLHQNFLGGYPQLRKWRYAFLNFVLLLLNKQIHATVSTVDTQLIGNYNFLWYPRNHCCQSLSLYTTKIHTLFPQSQH